MNPLDNLSERALNAARPLRGLALLLTISFFTVGCETLGSDEAEFEEEPLSVEEIVQPVDADPETILLAERAIDDGRYDDAEQLLARVLYTYPDDPRGQIAVGELRLAEGNAPAAMPVFADVLEDPEYAARAKQGYGITLLLIGDEDLAATHLLEAVELDPTLWRAWNALGAYYDAREEWPQASESYRHALEIQPREAFVQNNYGFSLFMQDRLDEAIDSLQIAFRLDPDSELIKTNLRLAYARKGQYLRALSGTSENDKAQNFNNVGYIALLRGDYDQAEAYFLQAMEADPRYNEVAARNLDYLNTLRQLDGSSGEALVN